MITYPYTKIRGRQAELGLTNKEVADQAGVSEGTVVAIRAGESVTTDSLSLVLRALQLEIGLAELPLPAEQVRA